MGEVERTFIPFPNHPQSESKSCDCQAGVGSGRQKSERAWTCRSGAQRQLSAVEKRRWTYSQKGWKHCGRRAYSEVLITSNVSKRSDCACGRAEADGAEV